MESPLYLQISFLAITIAVAVAIFYGLAKGLAKSGLDEKTQSRNFRLSLIGFLVWTLFASVMSFTDFMHDFSTKPPRQLMLIIPVFAFIFYLGFTKTADRVLAGVSNHWLLIIQIFRIPVEFFLWAAFIENIIPVQMTFEGRNFDIIAGITGPMIGLLLRYNQTDLTRKLAIAWNFVGIGLLINIIAVALLSTPVFFRYFMNDPANTFIMYFPYVFLPTIVAPAAMFFHVLSLRQLILKLDVPAEKPVKAKFAKA